MTKNLRGRYIAAHKARGYVEIQSRSSKFVAFQHPDKSNLRFIGKAGAVRYGKSISASLALTELSKLKLLFKVGDHVTYAASTSSGGTSSGVITEITAFGSIIVRPENADFILVFTAQELLA